MTINFTLIIQFLHFFIAYLIISRILLKPAIAIIQQEKKTENQLLLFAQSEELAIKEKKAYQDVLWKNAFNEFSVNKPDLEKEQKNIIAWRTPKPISISKEEILKTKNKLIDFVVSRVRNVQ